MIAGWLRSDASVRVAWVQAVVASEEGKRAADLAASAPEVALKDAEAAKERCRLAEAELETTRNERTVEACQLVAWEDKMKAREDAVTGRDTELEQSARCRPRSAAAWRNWRRRWRRRRPSWKPRRRFLLKIVRPSNPLS